MKPYVCLLQDNERVLHKASRNGQHEMLQHLLMTGIAVDVRDNVS